MKARNRLASINGRRRDRPIAPPDRPPDHADSGNAIPSIANAALRLWLPEFCAERAQQNSELIAD
jgi:hypothetical protein